MATRSYFAALMCGVILLTLKTATAAETPRAVFLTTSIEFGRVVQGEVVERAFPVTNEGNAPLTLKFSAVSMPGLKVRYQRSVAPGEQTKITLTLDTSGSKGEVRGQVLFRSNDPAQPETFLSLVGTVAPPVEILPHPAVYFSVYPGESLERSVTFVNNQDSPVNVLSLEKQGQHFDARLETVEAGRKYKVHITVPEKVEPGRYRERVLLKTDASEGKAYPVAVNVFVKPDLFVFPDLITYGTVSTASLRQQPELLNLLRKTLVVQKRAGNFRITSIQSTVPFLELTQTPTNQSQKFQIVVGLVPDRIEPGKIDGTITIKTDDPAFPELVIPVKGEFK